MKRILVYRFSAMGDVVMLLPVLKGLLLANPDLEIYFLTRPFLFPVFSGIDRLHLLEANLSDEHKGARGLYRLYKKIKTDIRPEAVFDLHQVLRSFSLNIYFRSGGVKVFAFEKGQSEKQRAVRTKDHLQLKNTVDRYAEVFMHAGLKTEFPEPPLFPEMSKVDALKNLPFELPAKVPLIGIAPFAKHTQKVWGITKVEQLMQEVNAERKVNFLLFGGGKHEMNQLDELAAKFSNTLVAAHFLNFEKELEVLPHLDLMISMDSANMHLAAMAGTPVISIWGATHPSLGFAPYKQSAENQVQYEGDKINCRPCSVYGNKKCKFGDVRCMDYVRVDAVKAKVNRILELAG